MEPVSNASPQSNAPIWRGFDLLLNGLGGLAALAIAFAALLICAEVLGRSVGWGTISASLEIVEYALFVATFSGAPWVLRNDGHVRVDVFRAMLPGAWGRAVTQLGNAIGLGCVLVMFGYSVKLMLGSQAAGIAVIKRLIFPEWWLFALVALSCLCLIVQFLRIIMRGGGDVSSPQDPGF
jgi:TRAP-type C4-dicarboxylate transport system permease small subunit